MMKNVKYRGMSKQRKAYLRGKLLERRKQLLSMMEQKVRQPRERKSVFAGDEFDMVNDVNDAEMDFMVASIESADVAQIEHALDRIEEGTYGQCASCGEKIPDARLKAMPFASQCVRCKEHQERSSARGSYGRAPIQSWSAGDAGEFSGDNLRKSESAELSETFVDSDND